MNLLTNTLNILLIGKAEIYTEAVHFKNAPAFLLQHIRRSAFRKFDRIHFIWVL